MSDLHGTFFTSVGCMDGRVQAVVAQFGHEKFGADYPDTITEAGLDGLIANTNDKDLLESLKNKILISVEKHHSKGIVVHGHEDCAGNPVSEEQHRIDTQKVALIIKEMLGENSIPVIGAYIKVTSQPKLEEI